jgi:cytoskeletal protein RodZ
MSPYWLGRIDPDPVSESPLDASAARASTPDPEGIPELVDLGQRLRRAREGRGIGVAELADRLHLGPEQLIALESGDRLHLHEPVFVIAQAKRVAQALGVDVSAQVEKLRHSRLMQTPAVVPSAAPIAPPPEDPQSSRPASWGLAAAIAALTLFLGVVVAQGSRLWAPKGSAPGSTATAMGGGNRAGAGGSTAAASPGVLLLRSEEPSWVEVRDAEGQTLFSGLLEKEARFRLGTGLRVLAGRPDLVTASVNGDAPRRLGTISEVDWQDFPAASAPATAPTPTPAP